MAKLFLFMMVSVDGFFEGPEHDLSWHNVDAEFNEFAIEQTKAVGALLFGRRTYELMKSYWPSEQARQGDPAVAELMNTAPKIVFSTSLAGGQETEYWRNVTLMKELKKSEIEKLKEASQKDLGIFGSNNLCVQLMALGLVDEFRIMVNPVAIGKGTPLFYGLPGRFKFGLSESRQFASGNLLLRYRPA